MLLRNLAAFIAGPKPGFVFLWRWGAVLGYGLTMVQRTCPPSPGAE